MSSHLQCDMTTVETGLKKLPGGEKKGLHISLIQKGPATRYTASAFHMFTKHALNHKHVSQMHKTLALNHKHILYAKQTRSTRDRNGKESHLVNTRFTSYTMRGLYI